MKMILFELGNITIQGMLLIPSGKHTKNYGTSPFIVDFPMKNGGSFPSVFCMFTRPGNQALQRGSSSNGAGPPGASRGPGNRWMLLGRSTSLTRLCRRIRQLTF